MITCFFKLERPNRVIHALAHLTEGSADCSRTVVIRQLGDVFWMHNNDFIYRLILLRAVCGGHIHIIFLRASSHSCSRSHLS